MAQQSIKKESPEFDTKNFTSTDSLREVQQVDKICPKEPMTQNLICLFMSKDPNIPSAVLCDDGSMIDCSILLPPVDGDINMPRDMTMVHYTRLILTNQCKCLKLDMDDDASLASILKAALISAKEMNRFHAFCKLQDNTMTQTPLSRSNVWAARKRLTTFIRTLMREFDDHHAFLQKQIQVGKQLSTILSEVLCFVKPIHFFLF